MNLKYIEQEDLLYQIENSNSHWHILSSINYEERSVYLKNLLLGHTDSSNFASSNLSFTSVKLTNPKASHWSILESIKVGFRNQIEALAKKRKYDFNVVEIPYPTKDNWAETIFNSGSFTQNSQSTVNLIIDFSAFPRDLIVQITDYLLGKGLNRITNRFTSIYLLHTSPGLMTSRDGLGPFSVGGLRGVNGKLLNNQDISNERSNLVVFLGYEGFEAKMAIDFFRGDRTNIDIIIDATKNFYDTYTSMISNQAILLDEIENKVRIHYCYNASDCMRIFKGIIQRKMDVCERFKYDTHSLYIAPFGSKWSVTLGCFAKKMFEEEMEKTHPHKLWSTNILWLKSYQYLSLYSRGSGTTNIFKFER